MTISSNEKNQIAMIFFATSYVECKIKNKKRSQFDLNHLIPGTVTALKAIIKDIAFSLSGKILRAVMRNYRKWAKSASIVRADIWNTCSNV